MVNFMSRACLRCGEGFEPREGRIDNNRRYCSIVCVKAVKNEYERSLAPLRKQKYARLKADGDEKYLEILEKARAQASRRRDAGYRKRWKPNLLHGARKHARVLGLPFTITMAEIYWPSHCPVLGLKLYYPDRCGDPNRKYANAPSLDRWNNSKGYIPGNVYVISRRANQIKSNCTADELRKVADYAEHGAASLFGRPGVN